MIHMCVSRLNRGSVLRQILVGRYPDNTRPHLLSQASDWGAPNGDAAAGALVPPNDRPLPKGDAEAAGAEEDAAPPRPMEPKPPPKRLPDCAPACD